jgi:hypothetical protein
MNQSAIPETTRSQRDNNRELLENCRVAYHDREGYFEDRKRAQRFYIGNQWGDKMDDPATGKTITEEDYIKRDGRMPVQNNQISVVVRNLVGQFRKNYPDPVAYGRSKDAAEAGEIMTAAMQRAIDINEGDELDARNFEEMVVSAAAGWKVTYGWRDELNYNDARVENIDQTRFFYRKGSNDIRNNDLWLVGELHDMRMDEIIANFAQNEDDVQQLRKMFPDDTRRLRSKQPDYLRRHPKFYNTNNPNTHRIVEAWRKEYRWEIFVHDTMNGTYERATPQYFMELGFTPEDIQLYNIEELVYLYNQERIKQAQQQGVDINAVPVLELDKKYDGIWRVYYMSPLGDVLYESDTPYKHGSHPYIIGLYPQMDGKLYSLVYSIIDQQKYINRLISLMDASLSKSVKNLMYVPESIVPDDMSREQFANQQIELGGYVFYEDKPGQQLPQPIKTNARVAGAKELLVLQMNFLQKISAVNDAVQGEEPPSGTPASLYAMRTENASVSNKDIFEYYFSIIRNRNRKLVETIKQFYQEKRYIKIAGSGFRKGVEKMYDPEKVRDVTFDIVMGETQQTLSYRQIADTYLKSFLDDQFITFEEYLQNTSLPFADQLMQTIKNRRGDGNGEGGFSPEMVQQIAQGNVPPELEQQLQQQQN